MFSSSVWEEKCSEAGSDISDIKNVSPVPSLSSWETLSTAFALKCEENERFFLPASSFG